MERLGGEYVGESSSVRRVAAASFVGTTIEWYDFFIYGTAAALVFPALFFPEQTPLIGALLAFSTFAVGFFARPFGGVVFGHFGDRIGRKSMLVLSLVMMGIATFAIGLLPGYATLGVLAPVLLVALRFVQGLGVGGEWGGAVLMAVEHAPREKRGFFGSFPQIGVPAGVILSNLVFLGLTATLSEEQFASWGWRVPFLLSIVLVGVGLFIRLKIMESPMFARVKATNAEARMPILEVLRFYPKQVLLAAGAFLANNAIGYIVFAYILSYGTQALGLSRSTMLFSVLIAVTVMLLAVVGFASLSDRIGRRKVFLAGAAFCGLWAFPFFWLLETRNLALVLLAPAVMLVGVGALHGPQAALYSEMFGTRVRYSGASLGYSLGAVFGGGLAPFIATALFAATGGSEAISAYLAALCLITFVSVLMISETYGTDLEEVRAEKRRPATEAGGARDRVVG